MHRQLTDRIALTLSLFLGLAVSGRVMAIDFTWNVDAGGIWERRTNWSPLGIPNSPVDQAIFAAAITAPRTVSVTSANGVTVSRIHFENSKPYLIDSVVRGGSVSLLARTAAAGIEVAQGTHQFGTVVDFLSTTRLDVAGGAGLEFNSVANFNGNRLTTVGQGEYRFNTASATSSGFLSAEAGTISGVGTIGADLDNLAAIVAPGAEAAGSLTIGGSYSQRADGRLQLQVGGVTPGMFDRLLVNDDANLAGRLEVAYIGGFVPTPGQSLPLVAAQAAVGGGFDSFFFLNAPLQVAADVVVSEADVRLNFVMPDLSNQFFGSEPVSKWLEPSNWTSDLVPGSTNVVALTNRIHADQTVVIPDGDSAFVHALTLQGGGAQTMTLQIPMDGQLSVTSQFAVAAQGRILLTGGVLLSSNLHVQGGGLLAGSGQVIGDVVVQAAASGPPAVLDPSGEEGRPGRLQIEGSYRQAAGGTLRIDIQGRADQSDLLVVSGEAAPGGTLLVDASKLEELSPGMSLQVMAASTFAPGAVFESVETTGTKDAFFSPEYGPEHINLIAFSPGDMNLDQEVNREDIPLFALGLTDPVAYFNAQSPDGKCICNQPFFAGNVNFDAFFDFDDIDVFSALVGTSVGEVVAAVEAAQRVPEPSSMFLLLLACIAVNLVSTLRAETRSTAKHAPWERMPAAGRSYGAG